MKKLEKFKFQEIKANDVRGGQGIDYSYQYFETCIDDCSYSDKRVDDICVTF